VETITRPGLALMTLQLLDKTRPRKFPINFIKRERNWRMRRANCRKARSGLS
jgi:hypothetical protein